MKSAPQTPEMQDLATVMAQRLAMAYLTATISNGYLEQSFEDMRQLRVLHRDIKQRATRTMEYYTFYRHNVEFFFSAGDKKKVGEAIVGDYEVLQSACDRYMMSGVRLSYMEAWNNDDIREEGTYLCRVTGAPETEALVLKWSPKIRQWLFYTASAYGNGWTAMPPKIKVVEVTDRITYPNK